MWSRFIFLLALIYFAADKTASGNEGDMQGQDRACIPCNTMVVFEDFESYQNSDALNNTGIWANPQLDTGSPFTSFLGRLTGLQSPEKPEKPKDARVVYGVPSAADYLIVSFDFYEIDDWQPGDALSVFFNGEKVVLKGFQSEKDEMYKQGSTRYGITWTADSSPNPPTQIGFGASKDQIHHVTAKIPSALFAPFKELRMRFDTKINDKSSAAAGIDNIKIEAVFECGICEAERVIVFEDFESQLAKGWVNGESEGDAGFSNYLGRYDKDDVDEQFDPVKTFIVPDDATRITVEWDFYEMDQWEGNDSIHAYINDVDLFLGIFNELVDEGTRHGDAKKGISWMSSSNGKPAQIGGSENYLDQKHHIKINVPRRVYRNNGGLLTLRLAARINDLKWNEAAAYDNIKLTAHFDCRTTVSPSAEPSSINRAPPAGKAPTPAPVMSPALSPAMLPAVPMTESASPSSSTFLSPVFTPTEPVPTGMSCSDKEPDVTFYVSPENPKANCTWLSTQPQWINQVCNPRSTAWFYCPITCGRVVG